MDEATLRDRIACLPADPAPLASDDASAFVEGRLTPAAVLIPIVLGPQPSILLTKRTSHLAKHAGQVSFPGGRIDPGEEPLNTALRETEEEIGLPRARVEILGRLDSCAVRSRFDVTPFVVPDQ